MAVLEGTRISRASINSQRGLLGGRARPHPHTPSHQPPADRNAPIRPHHLAVRPPHAPGAQPQRSTGRPANPARPTTHRPDRPPGRLAARRTVPGAQRRSPTASRRLPVAGQGSPRTAVRDTGDSACRRRVRVSRADTPAAEPNRTGPARRGPRTGSKPLAPVGRPTFRASGPAPRPAPGHVNAGPGGSGARQTDRAPPVPRAALGQSPPILTVQSTLRPEPPHPGPSDPTRARSRRSQAVAAAAGQGATAASGRARRTRQRTARVRQRAAWVRGCKVHAALLP